MPHWTVQHTIKVAIGFLVPILIGGIGYISWYASKVPDLETKLSKHDDKLATISANLIILMNQSGKPLEKKEIKDLLSHFKDSGNAKGNFIKSAEVISGNGVISVAEWIPAEESNDLKLTLRKGEKTKDKATIAKWITTSTLSNNGTVWKADEDSVLADNKTTKDKATIAKWITTSTLSNNGTVWKADEDSVLADNKTVIIKLHATKKLNRTEIDKLISDLNQMSTTSTNIVMENINDKNNIQ